MEIASSCAFGKQFDVSFGSVEQKVRAELAAQVRSGIERVLAAV